MATKHEDFIAQQLGPLLQPGEQPLYQCAGVIQPPFWLRVLCLGGLMAVLMTKAYFVILTNRRLIMIRTKMGMFGPGMANKGVEQFPVSAITEVKSGGLLNNFKVTFRFADGSARKITVAPWSKAVTGNAAFAKELAQKFMARQLPLG
ncbi:MAG TPA: hypothetical protein VGI10_23585 [Polyangiaceae bacterium]